MKEFVCSAKYNYGQCSYLVEKETSQGMISIIVYNTKKKPKVAVDCISFKDINKEYSSPFLSWYNLLFCSGCYHPVPDYDYMHQAVQSGKKTAATVYIQPDSNEGEQFVKSLPNCCGCIPYDSFMIYVFHKGCLADYFDPEIIREIYIAHGIFADYNLVQDYFKKPMSFFGDESQCGFSLQHGGSREQIIIKGILLGYPIESTISYLMPLTL